MSEPVTTTAPVAAPTPTAQTTSAPAQVTGDSPKDIPQTPSVPTETAPGADNLPKKYKLIVNGKQAEVEETALAKELAALAGEDGAVNVHQIVAASHERMAEAKKLRQQVVEERKYLRQLAENLQKDPISEMESIIGADELRNRFEEWYLKHLEYEALPEEQKQLKRRETEIEKREREIKEFEHRREAQELAQSQAKYSEIYANDIPLAISEVGLPQNPATKARVAAVLAADLQYMMDEERAGLPKRRRMHPREAAEEVRAQLEAEHEAIIGKMRPEEILQRFPSTAQKLAEQRAAAVAAVQPVNEVKKPFVAKPSPGRDERQKLPLSEYLRRKREAL